MIINAKLNAFCDSILLRKKPMNQGQAQAFIREVAEEFFGLTPDGRLDFQCHPAWQPFDRTDNHGIYLDLYRHGDLDDPGRFAWALSGVHGSYVVAIVRYMANWATAPG